MIAVLALLAMALTMFSTGLGLRGRDFRRALDLPGSVALGLGLQLGLMPLAGLAAGRLLGGPDGLGLMLVLLAPGIPASQRLVGLSGGHIGLARSLGAWGAVLAVPAMLLAGVPGLLPGFAAAILPFYLLPLLTGMALPIAAPPLGAWLERHLSVPAAVLTGVTGVLALMAGGRMGHLAGFGLALLLAGLAVLAGRGLARKLGRDRGPPLALAAAARNLAVPLGLALPAGAGGLAAMAVVYALASYLAVFALLAAATRGRGA